MPLQVEIALQRIRLRRRLRRRLAAGAAGAGDAGRQEPVRAALPRGCRPPDPAGEGVMSVTIERLVQDFGQGRVLDGIDLAVGKGEFVALLGPSGSGKTSLLRIIVIPNPMPMTVTMW